MNGETCPACGKETTPLECAVILLREAAAGKANPVFGPDTAAAILAALDEK